MKFNNNLQAKVLMIQLHKNPISPASGAVLTVSELSAIECLIMSYAPFR